MKTVLAFGDSNTHGRAPIVEGEPRVRFGLHERWPGVMRDTLGPDVWVIEEGQGARTTDLPDPLAGAHKNGAAALPVVLETHMPIDVVVINLGTNDLKAHFGRSAAEIADAAGRLARTVLASDAGPGFRSPQVLLVCPAPLAKLTDFADLFVGGTEKALRLPVEFARVAAELGVDWFEAGTVIASSDVDGIHLDVSEHLKLGGALAGKVREMLGRPVALPS